MSRVLDAFFVENGVYRLGQYAPVSIRDQVVRANYLIEHLIDNGELAENTRLVVLGAGAAGLTLATRAVQAGVRSVTLVERANVSLSLQARSSSRWIDPVQYDWPAAHWPAQTWPIPEGTPLTAVTLPSPALPAAVGSRWATTFHNRISGLFGRGIVPLYKREASPWRRVAGALEMDLKHVDTGVAQTVTADLLVLSAGFGVENARVPFALAPAAPAPAPAPAPEFQGLDFWSTDDFEKVDMGLPGSDKGALVSGAGDGALQDFIRLATGAKSARDILRAVWDRTSPRAVWKEQFATLWHWEDQAVRAKAFAPTPISECELLRRLQQRHSDAVEALATSPEWPTVRLLFDELTAGRRPGLVKLAYKCNHFSWCYPLNRTVALLTARYLKTRTSGILLPYSSLTSTTAIGHSCSAGCWRKPHEAHMLRGVTCDSPAGTSTTASVFDGLVIRHGIDPLTLGTLVFERLKPQVVPYHLP